ncbi:hypothetical protein M8C13_04385 [Crossiella sp. SN42]|uniref:hypothetical protein n=1 Tax=Crossiella sp. SN42 TaxID=2944808 RepID=UPI00207C18AF|nr:hypothetical protein [Crossiella sp. SN42]MCO1574996.1 hypothetical protein [Crossiella sp. SN42]
MTGRDQPAPLFDVEPVPTEALSGDRRRTQRQAAALAGGAHPLSAAFARHIRLHAEAAPADDRAAPGRRCGNCRFRQVLRYHARSYPKCVLGQESTSPGVLPPRITHGGGTDVRAWWPACIDHEHGDPALSPDAARYVPHTDREDTSSA